jgi:hypothetical protein
MAETFTGPRLKIERAKQHIVDLHSKVQGLSVGSFYVLGIESNPQTGNDVLKIEIAQLLPSASDFALIIGDALHNLESALDHTINEVVFRRLGRYDDHTKLPFRSTRNELIKAINGALIHQASEAVCDFIVNVIQPYDGGNSALWALNDLNNVDKHRLLLPVLHINVINNIRMQNDRGENHIVDQVMTRGTRFARLDLPGRNFKIADKGKASVLILFDKGSAREGEAILPTLRQFTEMVTGMVEGIEGVFVAENGGA